MPQFAPPPMAPRRASSIADLIMRRGDAQARGAAASGAIWGNTIRDVGNIAAGAVAQHGERKATQAADAQAAQVSEAFASVLEMPETWENPQAAVQAFTAAGIDPQDAIGYAKTLQDFRGLRETPDPDKARAALPGMAGVILALPPEKRADAYGAARGVLIASQLGTEENFPTQWSEEMVPTLEALRQGIDPQESLGGIEDKAAARARGTASVQSPPAPPKSLERIEAESAARAKGTASVKAPEGDIDWTSTGEEFLATLKPELQATVQQLGEYRRRPSATLYRSEQGRRLLAMVSQFNPEYDEKLYGEGQKAIGEYTSGATHRNIIAINTLSHHLIPFAEAADALDNNAIPKINEAWNYFRREFGSDVPTNFEGLHTLVSDEIANTFKTTGATDSAIKNAAGIVYSAQSPKQLLGALQRLARLAEGRIKAIGNKYDVTFGTGAFDKKGYISEDAQHAYQAIGSAASLSDISEGGTGSLEAVLKALEGMNLTPEEVGSVFKD